MPRKKRDPYVCPKCGTRVDQPIKTWQLVSPIPDAKGRITITVMGSFVCPNCGYKWRAVISKIKVGGEEVELEAGGRKAEIKSASKKSESEKERKSEGEVIEIDLDEI